MHISRSERLLLDRRRKGETQVAAAKRYSVPLNRYVEWEKGTTECPFKPLLQRLQPHERCLIHRRRSGRTQAKVAYALGRCRRWVTLMERGEVPCKELEVYWGE